MKDYYDIIYLARRFDFDGTILREAVAGKFTNRNRDFTSLQFSQLLALGSDDAMKGKWARFLKKVRSSETDFADALETINIFLGNVVAAAISGEQFDKFWRAAEGRWE